MKNFYLYLCIGFFSGIFGPNKILAQEVQRVYGEISESELALIQAPNDPDAAAVVLFDIGKSEFIEKNNLYYIKFTRHTRIKVFKKSATSYADVSIPYYVSDREESVSEIKACSYNISNGEIVKSYLSDDDIFREKTTENWSQVIFAVPKVTENTIFEYGYEIITPFFFNYRKWEFQSELPTLHSEYTAGFVPDYRYVFIKQCVQKLDVDTSYFVPADLDKGIRFSMTFYKYEMSNVPAFYEEKFLTTKDDYIFKVEFQLSKSGYTKVMTTWDELSEDLLADVDFGLFAKPNRLAKDIIKGLQLSRLSDTAKIKIISRYVKENYKWNGKTGVYTKQKKYEFEDKHTGNVAEVNLFLMSLLKAAHFKVFPVILSTRDHGKIRLNYPFLAHFNYVVVGLKLDGEIIVLDATERYLPYDVVPSRCLNNYAIVIKSETKKRFLKINDNANTYTNTTSMLSYNAEKSAFEGTCIVTASGYDALNIRNDWNVYGKDKIEEKLRIKLEGADFSNLEIKNERNYDKVLEISYNVSFPVHVMNDLIVFKPLFSYAATENPLKLEKRTYPVDFGYKRSRTNRVSLLVPSNYNVDELPGPTLFETSDKSGQFQFVIKQNGSAIQVLSIENFTKSEYNTSQYEELKWIFNQKYIKENEPITLKIN